MKNSMHDRVFNIPAGIPFAKALARTLLEEYENTPDQLSDVMILLPTRRACRVLHEAFLEGSNKDKAVILPRLQPIGDIDEEELSLHAAGISGLDEFLDIPPALSPVKRQVLLARLIRARPDFQQSFDHALILAAALGRFLDQMYTENLSFEALRHIVPEELADHWQITLNFLDIISEAWPQILKENGVIDAADRRNRLILALQTYWTTTTPGHRIIAAGTTGSIPAVSSLLRTITGLPKGQIILPGMDEHIDDESWEALEDSHPQFGFRHLLAILGIDRHHLKRWPGIPDNEISAARRHLISEVMRPAQTTAAWAEAAFKSAEDSKNVLEGLKILSCSSLKEEADSIALLMREALETPGKTAALVTADRSLARRVKTACQRWNIAVDDSAGQKLGQTLLGGFILLPLHLCLNSFPPSDLLAMMKHPLCRLLKYEEIRPLERALRGLKPAPGPEGLRAHIQNYAVTAQLPSSDTDRLLSYLDDIARLFDDILKLTDAAHSFSSLFTAHIKLLEKLAGREHLWSGEQGEKASQFLNELSQEAAFIPDLSLQDYTDLITRLLNQVTVRPRYGTHPRLMILGQLEARLLHADLVILGGLNEGSWPPEPGYDPWMSQSMRQSFGLPGYERSIGLSAHDFAQGFCFPEVVLCRARRVDGAPTVPARWLQRLETVCQAAGLDFSKADAKTYLNWAQKIDTQDMVAACPRPAPTPPLSARPRRLSVTRIEEWLRDPYSIYARYILKLRKLDPLEKDIDAAEQGSLLHKILERFVNAYPVEFPEQALAVLHDIALSEIKAIPGGEEIWPFWWPRFEQMMSWYAKQEIVWRTTHKVIGTECRGATLIETKNEAFEITAIADRIDRHEKGLALIDYKSTDGHTVKAIETGRSPQLPLEALILYRGGFENIGCEPVHSLNYWILKGSADKAGRILTAGKDIDELINKTHEGLAALINHFDKEDTPYYSLPDPHNLPRYSDYAHLSRVKEWGTAETEENQDEAA